MCRLRLRRLRGGSEDRKIVIGIDHLLANQQCHCGQQWEETPIGQKVRDSPESTAVNHRADCACVVCLNGQGLTASLRHRLEGELIFGCALRTKVCYLFSARESTFVARPKWPDAPGVHAYVCVCARAQEAWEQLMTVLAPTLDHINRTLWTSHCDMRSQQKKKKISQTVRKCHCCQRISVIDLQLKDPGCHYCWQFADPIRMRWWASQASSKQMISCQQLNEWLV